MSTQPPTLALPQDPARAKAPRGLWRGRDISRVSIGIWLVLGTVLLLWLWASWAPLDEVTVGTGRVVPSSKEQVVQSLEGGILAELKVKEGERVQAGQVLALLDRTRTESSVDESSARLRAALATSARLRAEVDGTALSFPPEVARDTHLVAAESALYRSRRDSLNRTLEGLEDALVLIRRELKITESLVAQGAASDVEVLRLKRQANDLMNKMTDQRTQYLVRAREELAKANAEIETQQSVRRGREDALARTTVTSPVNGLVKNIEVSTVGGVVAPNGRLMEIVPLGERLLVEARIQPRDVAFIYPGQRAVVKITAYDYAIYGGLEGQVAVISPDTIQDEVKRDQYYYRVYVQTESDHLTNAAGRTFPIVPGMVATADIHTGNKTVWQYLVKPLNRAREALRER